MDRYHVVRNIPGNTYAQNKATTVEECERLLNSLKQKWDDVKDLGFSGLAYDPVLTRRELIVSDTDGRVVDHYVIERVG